MNINISSSVGDSSCFGMSFGMSAPVPCLPPLTEASSGEGAYDLCQRWSHREDEYRMCLGRGDDDVGVKLKALLVK